MCFPTLGEVLSRDVIFLVTVKMNSIINVYRVKYSTIILRSPHPLFSLFTVRLNTAHTRELAWIGSTIQRRGTATPNTIQLKKEDLQYDGSS
jgi:hypothetical protein